MKKLLLIAAIVFVFAYALEPITASPQEDQAASSAESEAIQPSPKDDGFGIKVLRYLLQKEIVASAVTGLVVALMVSVLLKLYERKRAERQAIFELFIPEIHNKFVPRYMDAVGYANGFIVSLFGNFDRPLQQNRLKPTYELTELENIKGSFFHLMMFLKVVYDFIPFIFLQDRVGEKTIYQIEVSIMGIANKIVPKDRASLFRVMLEQGEKKHSFFNKLSLSPYWELFDNYRSWVISIEPTAGDGFTTRLSSLGRRNELERLGYLFHLFAKIMDYEANRIYDIWYGESTSYKFSQETLNYLEAEITPSLRSQVNDKDLERYLKNLKSYI